MNDEICDFWVASGIQHLYQQSAVHNCQQYGYADDLVLPSSGARWDLVESNLISDITDIAKLSKRWGLKLSIAKTTVTAFHLTTRKSTTRLPSQLTG